MTSTEIQICIRCKGSGSESTFVRTSGHDGEMKKDACVQCLGSGREIITITREPFIQKIKSEER